MPFKYNPPTRTECDICNNLIRENHAIIDSHSGKSSSSKKFPIHNWYYFVLGYSPSFPDYVIDKEKIDSKKTILDPFMGTGTTLVSCKQKSIPSYGVDANDFFVEVASTKLKWDIQLHILNENIEKLIYCLNQVYNKFNFLDEIKIISLCEKFRTGMLTERYISNIPLAKLILIRKEINKFKIDADIRKIFDLALHSIILPSSNVRYGPGFGIGKIKDDVDVLELFKNKINRINSDLIETSEKQKRVPSEVILGDSRKLSNYYDVNSIDYLITSPPYPGDHEYTKHTRLELIFSGIAENLNEFREIKKRMIRGSTTNIYKDDNEREKVKHFESIQKITTEIGKRLIEDNATSGFEKLYTKLIWEYFGGMYIHFEEVKKILKNGGKYYLLVGDSHAFKMVHIQTANILSELATEIGFKSIEIELWQKKFSSSHKYLLNEEILILTK